MQPYPQNISKRNFAPTYGSGPGTLQGGDAYYNLTPIIFNGQPAYVHQTAVHRMLVSEKSLDGYGEIHINGEEFKKNFDGWRGPKPIISTGGNDEFCNATIATSERLLETGGERDTPTRNYVTDFSFKIGDNNEAGIYFSKLHSRKQAMRDTMSDPYVKRCAEEVSKEEGNPSRESISYITLGGLPKRAMAGIKGRGIYFSKDYDEKVEQEAVRYNTSKRVVDKDTLIHEIVYHHIGKYRGNRWAERRLERNKKEKFRKYAEEANISEGFSPASAYRVKRGKYSSDLEKIAEISEAREETWDESGLFSLATIAKLEAKYIREADRIGLKGEYKKDYVYKRISAKRMQSSYRNELSDVVSEKGSCKYSKDNPEGEEGNYKRDSYGSKYNKETSDSRKYANNPKYDWKKDPKYNSTKAKDGNKNSKREGKEKKDKGKSEKTKDGSKKSSGKGGGKK